MSRDGEEAISNALLCVSSRSLRLGVILIAREASGSRKGRKGAKNRQAKTGHYQAIR